MRIRRSSSSIIACDEACGSATNTWSMCVRLHDRFGIADRAEAGEIRELAVVAVAEIADDAEPELIAMRVHPLEHRARQLAVAGDQHAVEVLARAMAPLDDDAHDACGRAIDEEDRADQEDAPAWRASTERS